MTLLFVGGPDLFDQSTHIPVVFARAEDIDEWSPGLLSVGAMQPVLLPFLAEPPALFRELALLPGLLELGRAVSQLWWQTEVLGQGRL